MKTNTNIINDKEVMIEWIQLGRGNAEKKKELAKRLGVSFSTLKYRVAKFKSGKGLQRKKRSDAGIPKKDPEQAVKIKFFASLATGMSLDEAQIKHGLTEHQANRLSKEYKTYDKFKALRNAPQLKELQETIAELFRLDLAIVDAELNGAYNVKVANYIIPIPVQQIRDIQIILAYCLQIDEMAKQDPRFKNISEDDLLKVRLDYLKQELTENRNITELTRLLRATKVNNPERQLDLQLVFSLIDRYQPGLDETGKIKIVKQELDKIKTDKN